MKAAPKTSTASTLQRKPAQPFFGKAGSGTFMGGSPFIQAKLTVGQPNDPYEREADRMADHVVQRLAQTPAPFAPAAPSANDASTSSQPPLIQAKCADCEAEEKLHKKEEKKDEKPHLQTKPIFETGTTDEQLQRKCADCEGEDQLLQREETGSAEPTVSSSLESRLVASKGSGSALPEAARQQMERSMGADFSGVRVHTGSSAVQMSQELSAHAFTHGSDIYFNSGKYNPASTGGQHLLAHELTHTVQQGGGTEAIRRVPTRGAGGCGPANSVDEDNNGARGAGKTAHAQIQNFLLPTVLGELPISRGTKANMSEAGCQNTGTELGFADLFILGMNVEIAEIKPFLGARNGQAKEEAEHYIRRGRQSMERFSSIGECGLQGAGQDDRNFAARIGASSNRPPSFYKINSILQNDTVIGRFDGDPTRTLKAKLVEPGAVGYWCTGTGTDTYVCGVSQNETDAYIDSVLLPAQNLIDDLLKRTIEEPLDSLIGSITVNRAFGTGQQYAGGLLGSQLQLINSYLPPGVTIDQLINLALTHINPYAHGIIVGALRRLKSILLNDMRIALRNMLRGLVQEALAALCIGAPVVTFVQLMEELERRIRAMSRELIPVMVAAAAMQIVGEMMMALLQAAGQVMSDMIQALGEFLGWVLDMLISIIEIVLRIVLALVVALLALGVFILAIIAIFDPVPGDETLLGAIALLLARLVPLILGFA
ncbi:DUF4157 domain-containing protein [Spirosoma panaciterrae]|uniref:eCIS core domain-containing protein n=1 Tax=Spirosoma panaciterrae TaxID=496058 RepID=UPI0003757E83|nr:DUF4157 domain-containing protein [Spirosoma panaciterrae]